MKKKIKILLIQPPVLRKPKKWEENPLVNEFWKTVNMVDVQYGDIDTEPNHGLLSIGAILKKNGYNIKLCDFHSLFMYYIKKKNKYISLKQIEKMLLHEKFTHVCISCLTPNSHWAYSIVKILKKINPNCYIILGGIHATFNARDILKENEAIDVIVRGEGEITILELLEKIINGKNLDDVQGVTYRHPSGEIVDNKERPLIENLDSLPYPAYELLPEEAKPIVFRVLTGRGCKYKCIFCAPSALWRQSVRYRNYKKVVDEIEYLQNKFKSEYFLLGDLTFFQDEEGTYERLCEEIIRRKLKIKWWCQSRLELITPQRATLLRKAGCIQMGLGIETAVQTVRDYIGKENEVDKIKKACRCLKENRIRVQGYFMIGLPNETLEDAIKTIKLIEELITTELVDVTNIAVMVPYPCTKIYFDAEHLGIKIIDKDYRNYYMGVSKLLNPYPVYETKYLTRNEIRALWELALATATKAHKKILNKRYTNDNPS